MLQVRKTLKSSRGSRRARMILEKVQSKKQSKKVYAKGKSSKITLKAIDTVDPLPVPRTYEKNPSKVETAVKTFPIMEDLKTKFNAVESTLRFYQGRGQLGATFDNLKQSVERTSKKQFTTNDVGQLLRLVPDLYQVKWVQIPKTNADDGTKTWSYQLQIMPRNHLAESQGDNSIQFMKPDQGDIRATLFSDRMMSYTKAIHRKWCREQGVKSPAEGFHPDFQSDDTVNVKPRDIPSKPQRTELSAREALLKYSQRSKLASKSVQQRLAKLSASEKSGLSSIIRDSIAKFGVKETKANKDEENEAVLDMSKIPESLRSLPRETLLKLQGKSKARQILKVDKAAQNRKKMLEQLPELVRIIKVFLRSNKRTAMPLSVFTVKMAGKLKSNPSPTKTQEMIGLLCDVVPEFCEILTGVLKVFKLKRGCNSSVVFRKISKAIQQIEI